MKLVVDEEFRSICRHISEEYDRLGDASLIDSDDLIQSQNFCGGWDSESSQFGFSFYAPDGGDYIFSITLDDARIVAQGGIIDPTLEYWKKAPDW